jgi:hypothetical protein
VEGRGMFSKILTVLDRKILGEVGWPEFMMEFNDNIE